MSTPSERMLDRIERSVPKQGGGVGSDVLRERSGVSKIALQRSLRLLVERGRIMAVGEASHRIYRRTR